MIIIIIIIVIIIIIIIIIGLTTTIMITIILLSLMIMIMLMMMMMIAAFWKSMLTLGTNCGVTHRQPPIIGFQICQFNVYFSYKRWDRTLCCFASFYRLTPKIMTAWNILTKIQDTQTSHKGTK